MVGACEGVERVVGELCDGAAHHVHDAEHRRPAALALLQGGDGVRRLAGLGDHQHQGVFIHHGIGIAQLAGQLHLHGDAAELFDGIAPGAARVVGRAAGGDDDLVDVFQFFSRQFEAVQLDLPLVNAGGEGGFDGGGLLHDLLEHEVLIAALLGGLHTPGHAADGLLQLAPGAVADGDGLRGELCKLPVLHVDDVFGVGHQRRHVRGEVVLSHPDAEDEGAGLPHHIEGVGGVGAEDAERVGTLQPRGGLHDGGLDVPGVVELQQMDDGLGVGLALEDIAVPDQLFAQLQVVFDDAVVYHGKAPVVGQMRVGV